MFQLLVQKKQEEEIKMINGGKKNILGIYVNAIDCEASVKKIISAAKRKEAMGVSALAAHGVMTGFTDPLHLYRLNHINLVIPDGQPVRWALNWIYKTNLSETTNGSKLMLKVCKKAAEEGLPVYFYGSHLFVIKKLIANLKSYFPNLVVAGFQPSKFRKISSNEKKEVIRKIKNSHAAITFVGLGCPRQEVWVYEYQKGLLMPILAVGAAFNFHSNTLPRAPAIMQRLGLEWLFRLIKEPRRLWKRYTIQGTMYIALLLLQLTGLKKFDKLKEIKPKEEILYG